MLRETYQKLIYGRKKVEDRVLNRDELDRIINRLAGEGVYISRCRGMFWNFMPKSKLFMQVTFNQDTYPRRELSEVLEREFRPSAQRHPDFPETDYPSQWTGRHQVYEDFEGGRMNHLKIVTRNDNHRLTSSLSLDYFVYPPEKRKD